MPLAETMEYFMTLPYLTDRSSVDDAARLIAQYGAQASGEAAVLASLSRDRGNYVHFCRWRQIERLILVLSMEEPVGMVH